MILHAIKTSPITDPHLGRCFVARCSCSWYSAFRMERVNAETLGEIHCHLAEIRARS